MRHLLAKSIAIASGAAFALVMGGCPTIPNNTNSNSSGKAVLKPFTSSDEFVKYVRSRATSSNSFTLFRSVDLAATPAESGAADGATTNAAPTTDQSSFSTTNIQEAGVDESDVFKSDGTNFYLAKQNSLRIVHANPQSELAEIGRLDLDQHIDSLYLDNGKLIVLAQDYGQPYYWEFAIPAIWPPYYSSGHTFVYDINIADPANPAISKKIELDGSLVSSRLTNGRLILVLNIVPNIPQPLTIFTPLSAEEILPKMHTDAGDSAIVSWSQMYHPDVPNGYNMTSVATIDAANIDNVLDATAVMANAGTIYVSPNAVYVTDTDYDEADNYRETTAIHKFAFDDKGVAQYVASGSISGRLLNQFALSEKDGYLRTATYVQPTFFVGAVDDVASGGGTVSVASTTSAATAQAQNAEPSNSVYVLGQNEGELVVVGKVEGIAPNERIYSARFLGSRGFLVTYRQIDPLFALDLADPANPKVVGELKVPGYSDYLHPIGEKLLIGVGRAVASTSWGVSEPSALQLSLFDVSELTNPTLIQQLSVGGYGSLSEANYNHKAFTYLPQSGVLALPATITPDSYQPWFVSGGQYTEPKYSTGVLAYHVTETGFAYIGFLDDSGDDSSNGWWWPEWRRAAIINDTLYAANPLRVTAAPLSNLPATSRVDLAPNPETTPPYVLEDGGATAPDVGVAR